MKGDRVEILVDAGTGSVERFEISATKAGRRIEKPSRVTEAWTETTQRRLVGHEQSETPGSG